MAVCLRRIVLFVPVELQTFASMLGYCEDKLTAREQGTDKL